MTDRGSLELVAAEAAIDVGPHLKEQLPKGLGFTLLIFDIGEKGNLAYVSSAERASMVEALKELIQKMEGGQVSSAFGGLRS